MSLNKLFRFALVVCFLFSSLTVHATPTRLGCVTSDGQRVARSLYVDLEKKVIEWGLSVYDIVHANENYISAYERSTNTGGEVFVIDRNTGEYQRGAVGIYYSFPSQESKGTFQAITMSGYCTKKQL